MPRASDLKAGAPRALERALVAGFAAGFLYLVTFRSGRLIFPFLGGSNGVFFDEGARVLGGEVMYRDFFEFVMPGTAHLFAAVFALLGASTAALGAALVAQGALLAALAHGLASRVAGAPWRLIAPATFTVLVYAPYTLGDHKWPALACAFGSLLVLTGGPTTTNRAFAGGLLAGASAVFTQDMGLGLVAGALIGLALERVGSRSLLAAAAGGCVVPLLTLGCFAWAAGPATVFYDCVTFPLTRYPEFRPFSIGAAPPLRALPRELAQVALAVGGLVGGLVGLSRRGNTAVRVGAAAGLGVLAATLHRGVYPAALAIEATLLLPLLPCVLAPGLRPRWARWPALALAAGILPGLLHGSAGFVVWRQRLQPLALESHRAGDVWLASPMPELSWIETLTSPGEGVFLLPARGGHYFLTGTRNVTSFPYLIEGQTTEAQARQALQEIDAARPAVGLWDTRPGGPAPQASLVLTPLLEGLLERYQAEALPSGVLLLRRRDTALARHVAAPGEPAGETDPHVRP